ncbi:G-protein coupled receptor family C group 6 member A-like [Cebidichthys violaceus]|uniref:G-protein coupled receptor family C group 6 member A-like n=1 Tax=Cebidichthys violaceus TaxID=271503 RepID=UPI0035CC336A
MAVFCPCSGEKVSLHAYSPGDIMIGGVFPIHREINRSTLPGQLSCSSYDIRSFLHTQVMIHGIREINQRTPRVLPNFTIGYDIYDTCGDVSLAIRATLQLLRRQSEPQSCFIGYSATSQLLSRKFKFPTFLRTIPSDEHQTKAIAELVTKFNWKTVAIVASDDEYGKYGSENLEDLFSKMKDICNEFIFILPGNFSQNNSNNHTCLADLISKINESSAEAIILFTKESNVEVIMEAAIKRSLNRRWIATDAWSTSMTVSALAGIEMAGEVFGFVSKRNEVPGFKDYVISMFNGTTNGLLEDYLTHYPLCSNQSVENGESTPVVKAVGGYLCLLELFSLLACFCLSFSFAGKPTNASCMVGLPLFGIAFSLCISCILANLLQIFVGFSFQLNKASWAKRLHQPAAVVTIITGIQLALCVPWLCYYPPHANEEIFRESILKQCEKGSYRLFIAMLAYNAFLALICFLFAFKGKQLPDLYNNASLITISMLLFLIVWVFFIPIYISLIGRYKSAIESAAILISSYSILGCHLAPKCYIMVFRKELNDENAITEYIRKHYEQKGVAVVTS